MIVKVLNIPVRYKGETHPSGQLFEMEDEHFDKNIVKKATAEEEEEAMAKYSRAADRSGKPVEPEKEEVKTNVAVDIEKKEAAVEAEDYKTVSRSKLEGIKNDDLKAYLNKNEIKYANDAEKKDLINLILGE
ncbi:hypothetical protein [Planomicrobium okeanokoites]|uniref:hypothetical protein n=1 Tax=Planomicrobium okeanokoites TaxID=244 RepID=UPI000A076390|nr:hypothetical protein [Planomicrobium okeanokoites]